ncbi:uncharacterized protein [Notamacropus eugenii]|uniref:uncharacterized protein isoform X2 n=1 Tax=Notamacropus eugenii TaxID=9315 RepID=UPI003B66C2FD
MQDGGVVRGPRKAHGLGRIVGRKRKGHHRKSTEVSQSTRPRAMFEFIHQRFLILFLFTWVLLDFPSHVRVSEREKTIQAFSKPTFPFSILGNCISEGVTSLNRTQGEHVLIHLDQNITKETELKLYLVSKNLLLLTISPGESRTTRIIPRKEYEGRLSVPDDKTLMLMSVTSEDSGCYEAHIRSASGKMHIQKFNLTVFGSVNMKFDMKLCIGMFVFVSFIFLIAVCVCCPKIRQNCLKNTRGICRRRRNIQQEEGTEEEGTYNMSHREERRLEEGCEPVHVTSLSDQETETQMRSQG